MEEAVDGLDNAFADKNVRHGFIRKVYLILTAQLLVTGAIVSVFVLVPEVRRFSYRHRELFYVALGLTIALMLVLQCCSGIRRRVPFNYLLLGAYTLCEGYLLGSAAACYDASEVAIALAVTIVVVAGLTLFAFQTRVDFTAFRGIMVAAMLALSVFGLLTVFVRLPALRLFYACAGTLLFCAFIVMDTQLMVGGKHKYALSPEDYVAAALNLYMDVVNLFLFVLSLVNSSCDSS